MHGQHWKHRYNRTSVKTLGFTLPESCSMLRVCSGYANDGGSKVVSHTAKTNIGAIFAGVAPFMPSEACTTRDIHRRTESKIGIHIVTPTRRTKLCPSKSIFSCNGMLDPLQLPCLELWY